MRHAEPLQNQVTRNDLERSMVLTLPWTLLCKFHKEGMRSICTSREISDQDHLTTSCKLNTHQTRNDLVLRVVFAAMVRSYEIYGTDSGYVVVVKNREEEYR